MNTKSARDTEVTQAVGKDAKCKLKYRRLNGKKKFDFLLNKAAPEKKSEYKLLTKQSKHTSTCKKKKHEVCVSKTLTSSSIHSSTEAVKELMHSLATFSKCSLAFFHKWQE